MTKLQSPIILLCSERSGSNLITKMLDADSSICGPGACHLFRVIGEFSNRFSRNDLELKEAVLHLFRLKSSVWKIDKVTHDLLLNKLKKCETPAEMVAALYQAELEAHNKKVLVIKENSAYQYLYFMREVLSKPRFLFMVRDPRGMAASWKASALVRGGVVRAVNVWIADQAGYLRVQSQFPKNTSISFLRYEDLVVKPSDMLTRVCSELGLAYSENMVHFNKYSESAIADAARSPMWANLDSSVSDKSIFRFKKELDSNEIAYIDFRCKEFMALFGYPPYTKEDSQFGEFANWEDLKKHIESNEPDEKPEYVSIREDIRRRFEIWSSFYKELEARPIVFKGVQ